MINFTDDFYTLFGVKKEMDNREYKSIEKIALDKIRCNQNSTINCSNAIYDFYSSVKESRREFEENYIRYKICSNKRCKDCAFECCKDSKQRIIKFDCEVGSYYLNKAHLKSSALFKVMDIDGIMIPMFIKLGIKISEEANLILKLDLGRNDEITKRILDCCDIRDIRADSINIVPYGMGRCFTFFRNSDRFLLDNKIFLLSKKRKR